MFKLTPAGDMRHRMTFEREITTNVDALNQPVKTWEEIGGAAVGTGSAAATRWVSIEQLSGRELFAAQQVQPDATHRIRLRFDADGSLGLTPADRGRHEGEVFNLLWVDDRDRRRIEYEILAVRYPVLPRQPVRAPAPPAAPAGVQAV